MVIGGTADKHACQFIDIDESCLGKNLNQVGRKEMKWSQLHPLVMVLQPGSQPCMQQVRQPVIQAGSQSARQPATQPVSQPNNQPPNQPIKQPDWEGSGSEWDFV